MDVSKYNMMDPNAGLTMVPSNVLYGICASWSICEIVGACVHMFLAFHVRSTPSVPVILNYVEKNTLQIIQYLMRQATHILETDSLMSNTWQWFGLNRTKPQNRDLMV